MSAWSTEIDVEYFLSHLDVQLIRTEMETKPRLIKERIPQRDILFFPLNDNTSLLDILDIFKLNPIFLPDVFLKKYILY